MEMPVTVRVNVVVPSAVEAAFRAEVFARKGMRKGNISEAITEAMRLWIDGNGLSGRTRAPHAVKPPARRRRTPQEAAVARMSAGERMELAYRLSTFTRGEG